MNDRTPDRRRFRPTITDGLEPRVVPSRAGAVAPVQTAALNLSARTTGGLTAQAIAQINQLFDSFSADYVQAQGAYFANNPAQATPAAIYFQRYIIQRIKLLSEQLTRVFVQLPGATKRLHSSSPEGSLVLQAFLRSKITGTTSGTLRTSLAGSSAADMPIPALGTVTNGASTLYTAQALASVEAARTATLNAAGYLIRHTFHNK